MDRENEVSGVDSNPNSTNYCKFSAAMVQNLIQSYHRKGTEKEKVDFRSSEADDQRDIFLLADEKSNSDSKPSFDAGLKPYTHKFDSVLLFVDISGFTRLCHRLRPEATKWHINTYFTMMIDIIFSYGGDVHKFIGDAIICVWPLRVGATQEEFRQKGLTAVRCALALMESECSRYDQVESGVKVSLRLHAGITHGLLHGYHVGDADCWEYLIAGKPLSEMSSALDNASHGEVAVSAAFWHDLIQGFCEGELHESGNYLVKKVDVPEESLLMQNSVDPANDKLHQDTLMFLDHQKLGTSHKVLDMKEHVVLKALGGLVPGVARHHAVNDSLDYLSELRTVTVMFINIDSLIPYLDSGNLDKVQQCMEVTAKCVNDKQGTFVQFVYDDKGVVIIAAFGLPGRSHENDIRRGLLCAMSVEEELSKINLQTDIGITTGKVYCGLVGSSYRCAFGVMGASMNLAARLMGACMKKSFLTDRIASKSGLCKENVHIICNDILQAGAMQDPKCCFEFTELPAIKAKGYDDPVKIFIPRKVLTNNNSMRNFNRASSENMSLMKNSHTCNIIGRDNEIRYIRKFAILEKDVPTKALNPSDADIACKIIFAVGEAGVGKSHLLQYVAWSSAESNYHNVLYIHGDSENMGAPMLIWETVLQGALRIVHENGKKKRSANNQDFQGHTILQTLQKSVNVKRRKYCMLLAPFIPSLKSLPLSGQIQAIAGTKVGLQIQIDMLVDILSSAAVALKSNSEEFSKSDYRKIVLMIEDAHFLDKSSWQALRVLAERKPENILVIAAMRPLQHNVRLPFILETYNDLIDFNADVCEEQTISPLTKSSCAELLACMFRGDRKKKQASCETEDDEVCIIDTGYDDNDAENKRDIDEAVPSAILNLIFERCHGNPLFLLGLVEVIQSEFPQVESMSSETNRFLDVEQFSTLQTILPANIQSVVTARFDKLNTNAQLVLKTASCLGYSFTFPVLKKCYHHTDNMTAVEKNVLISRSVEELVNGNFISMTKKTENVLGNLHEFESTGKTLSKYHNAEFSFNSRVVYEIVYELMLKEQRAAIHQRVGRYYEACNALFMKHETNTDQVTKNELVPTRRERCPTDTDYELFDVSMADLGEITKYELNMRLAYHWSRTDKPDKAVEYLKLAGKHATSIGAYEEAEELYYRAWQTTELRLLRIGIDIDSEVKLDTEPLMFDMDLFQADSSSSIDLRKNSIDTDDRRIDEDLCRANTLPILSIHVNSLSEINESDLLEDKGEKYALSDDSDAEPEPSPVLVRRRKKRPSIVTDSKWNNIQKNLRRASSAGDIPDEIEIDQTKITPKTPPKTPELKRTIITQMNSKRPSYHKNLRKHSQSTPPSSPGRNGGGPPSPGRTSYLANLSRRRESEISVKKLNNANELMSASGREIRIEENVPQLLSQLTNDLTDLSEIYSRYRIPHRQGTGKSSRELLIRAKIVQQYATKAFTGKVDESSMALVLHNLAFALMFSPSEFELESIQNLVVEYFTLAIKFRKQANDWPAAAESLNGLGTCYQKLASSHFRGLEQDKPSLRTPNTAPEYNKSDMLIRKTQVKSLMDLAEETFKECLTIRKKYAKAEMGQVETSLGNFYLRYRNDFRSAQYYFENAIKNYSMFQGDLNPRSAYALDGLARTHLCKANHFKEQLDDLEKLGTVDNDDEKLHIVDSIDEELEQFSGEIKDRKILLEQRQRSLFLAYSLAYVSAEIRQNALSENDPLYKTTMALLDTISETVHWPWGANENDPMDIFHQSNLVVRRAKSRKEVEVFCEQMLSHNPDMKHRFSSSAELMRQQSFFSPPREEQLTSNAAYYWPELKYFVGWSTALGGCTVEPEENRALASMLSFHWILANKYEYFVRCQMNDAMGWFTKKNSANVFNLTSEANSRIKPEQFKWIREFMCKKVGVDTPADVDLLMTMLVVTDLFKVDSFILDAFDYLEAEANARYGAYYGDSETTDTSADEFEKDETKTLARLSQAHFDNRNDKSVLMRIIANPKACKRFLPSVARLPFKRREMLQRGLSTGFILGQFVQLESVPASLSSLRTLAMIDPKCSDMYLLHMLLDIAGARGDVSLRGSITMDGQTSERLIEALETLELFKKGHSETDLYDFYLKQRGESIGLPCSEPANTVLGQTQRAQVRLCGMLRIETSLGVKHVIDAWNLLPVQDQVRLMQELNRNGITDGWAILPYYGPRLLKMFYMKSCEVGNDAYVVDEENDHAPRDSEDGFSPVTMSLGFKLLTQVFRKARAILNDSILPDENQNGVYVVKMTNLAKMHVIDSVIHDGKFVYFTIHHKDTLGDIVLGHS